MQVVRKSIKCSSEEEYYKLHLNIINPLLPNKLTEKEIMILSSFMSVDDKLVEDDRFNSLVRKKVMEKHKLSAGGLSNHLKSMIEKGFLNRSDVTGRIKINSFVLPGKNMQGYQFRIGYAIQQKHNGEAAKKILEEYPKGVTREEVEEEKTSSETLMPTKDEIEKAMEEQHNNFDEADIIGRDVIIGEEEEDENETPYKIED